jgi:hypothetical protein
MNLLLQPRIRRCNGPSHHSVGQRTTASAPPAFAAPSARLLRDVEGGLQLMTYACGAGTFAGVCAASRRTFMSTPGSPWPG